jgi:hypothetical protein
MRHLERIFACLAVAINVLVAQDSKPRDSKVPIPLKEAQHVCSVPLLNLHVDHPEKFAMPAARPPHKDPMPRPVAPAPPCEKNNQNSTK